MSYTTVGVIGHIDHGKTALVAALTEVNTDTHPEEKRRGITIDLGFASFARDDHLFALIDAPGHQRYIGNLFAGVAAVDVGLLVVASDQGIQAQTLEHASILRLLGVQNLIVALSRTDLTSSDAIDDLREELEFFLEDGGFSSVPMVAVSTVTGEGLDELRSVLLTMAKSNVRQMVLRYFRMPVDRVFTVPGRGCVVAGKIWSGQVATGDTLQLSPFDRSVRVRGIEVHGKETETSSPGFRTALNLAGVSASEVHRGCELIEPDIFPKITAFLAELRTLPHIPELKCPATVQVHLGTTACSGRITGVRRLGPASSVVAVIEVETSVVVTCGQKCLLRLPYPVGTVAGATVLGSLPDHLRRRRRLVEFGERLAMGDKSERLVAWTAFLGEINPHEGLWEVQLGLPHHELQQAVEVALESGQISAVSGTPRVVAAATLDQAAQLIRRRLTEQTEGTDDVWCSEEAVILYAATLGSSAMIRMVLNSLVADGQVVRLGNRVALASDQNRLSKKQLVRMAKISEFIGETRSPPTVKELAEKLQMPLDAVESLSRFGIQAGMILDLGGGFLVSAEVFSELCRELNELFSQCDELTVAEIRDRWQITRKHAVPYLEYCDRINITVRSGNTRTAGPRLSEYQADSHDGK